jgi:nucleotide-binding universal stress UspA family protein
MERSVFRTLCSMISPGANSFVVCGTRVLGGGRGLLSGTVSERLLRAGESNVLALRVLQPGLLGCPRDVLLPVSGHPRGFRSGLPFLRLLGPDIEQMHILFVRRIARWRYRTLSSASADALRAPGQAFCERVDREIAEQLGLGPAITDANAIVSDDVPKEIVIAANKTKSRLIYLGASERNLSERFLYGNPIEQVLRDAACDVAVYRGVE